MMVTVCSWITSQWESVSRSSLIHGNCCAHAVHNISVNIMTVYPNFRNFFLHFITEFQAKCTIIGNIKSVLVLMGLGRCSKLISVCSKTPVSLAPYNFQVDHMKFLLTTYATPVRQELSIDAKPENWVCQFNLNVLCQKKNTKISTENSPVFKNNSYIQYCN